MSDGSTEDVVVEPAVRVLPEGDELLLSLLTQFEDVGWHSSLGQDVFVVPAEQMGDVAAACKAAGFEMCADVTAVDHLGRRDVRFDVVVVLFSIEHARRLRLIAPLDADDDIPSIPSVTPIWPGASFFEREVYDMFGIDFEGHPDMSRILMPDEWEGHPLRKDFATGSIPVQFKEGGRS